VAKGGHTKSAAVEGGRPEIGRGEVSIKEGVQSPSVSGHTIKKTRMGKGGWWRVNGKWRKKNTR